MISRFRLLIVTALFLLIAPDIHAETRIKVSGVFAPRISLAVARFEDKGATRLQMAKEMTDLIEDDLLLSGFFNPIDNRQFIEDAESIDRRTGKINIKEWSAIGAGVVVKGNYLFSGETITIECRAINVSRGEQIYLRKYRDSAAHWRKIIHTMADEIVFEVSGEKGLARTKIAFTSTRDGEKKIYTMDAGGHNWRRINSGPGLALYPDWTPDGHSLAYTSYSYGFPWVFLDNLTAGKRRVLSAQPGLNAFPAISPDGRWVTLTLSRDGNNEIYKMRLDGSDLTRLTHGRANDCSPDWSPDGRRIAFTSDRRGTPQIYIMNADGGNVRRLTMKENYNTSPDWSPRGDLIAYTSRIKGSFEICTIDIRTGEVIRLTNNWNNDEDPSWAPDGRHLIYSSRQGGRTNLFVLDIANPRPIQITTGKDCFSPAWGPYGSR
ncbi:MAG: Tol-Pal system beta propeller repeat protein TolB [Candidatus Euphemobacter frigidus]|nr:Tol-Pal system beta propeller repeat protein TolB [Candidatus Euphemobacter frigidus]MDP8276785.1 Tol-Pal system beta propeller repeat protein TolB [Candidatus Euphemobacter frigidus]